MTYHTLLKDAIRSGKCPKRIGNKIPRSNVYRWKNEPFDKYRGHDLSNDMNRYINLLDTIQHCPGAFYAYGKLISTFINISHQSKSYLKALQVNKELVVKTISDSGKSLTINKALKVFGISIHTFRSWKQQVELPCKTSKTKLCVKVHPGQLSNSEVSKMADILIKNTQVANWPIASICYWARRNNHLFAGLTT